MKTHGIPCRNITQVKTRRKHKLSLKIELENTILKEWQRMSSVIIKNVIYFMSRKLKAVIDAIGVHSKYLFYKNVI